MCFCSQSLELEGIQWSWCPGSPHSVPSVQLRLACLPEHLLFAGLGYALWPGVAKSVIQVCEEAAGARWVQGVRRGFSYVGSSRPQEYTGLGWGMRGSLG